MTETSPRDSMRGELRKHMWTVVKW